MKTKEEIFSGVKLSGIPMLLFNLLFLIGIVVLFIWTANAELSTALTVTLIISYVGSAVKLRLRLYIKFDENRLFVL